MNTCIIWGTVIGAVIGAIFGGFGGFLIGMVIGAGCGIWGSYCIDEEKLCLRASRIKQKEFDAIQVDVKGVIAIPKTTTVEFILLARDCSGNRDFEEGDPVLTSDDRRCSLGNRILSPKQAISVPNKVLKYSEWTTKFTIPIDCLLFPYKGAADIELVLVVRDKKEKIYAAASTKINVFTDKFGYMEHENFLCEADKMALQIVCTIVFVNSGFFTLDTTRVIKDWIKERQDLQGDSVESKEYRRKLSTLFQNIKNSTSAPSVSKITFQARELSEMSACALADKYAFMEFFLKVVASFESITDDDIKLLDLIASEMSLDNEEYQKEKQKYLPIHEIDDADPFQILGITPSMSNTEKKKKLRELFAKWNALATHKDPEIRKKAEKMLSIITDCQKQIQR